MAEFLEFYDALMSRPRIACDLETDGFKWFAGNKIIGMSFGWGADNFYLPISHSASVLGGEPPSQLDFDILRPYLQKFFSRKDCFTIWANGRFDHKFYKAQGVDITTPWHDTLHLGKRVDENMPGALKTASSGWRDMLGRWHKGIVHPDANKDEKSLSEWRGNEAKARRAIYKSDLEALYQMEKTNLKYQGLKKAELKKFLARNQLSDHKYKHVEKDDIHYGYVPVIDMVKYAALDTFLTYKLYEHFLPIVSANPKAAAIYKNEIQLSKVLQDSEMGGVYIDVPYIKEVDKVLYAEIQEKKDILLNKLGKINVIKKKATKTKPAIWAEDYPNLGSTDQLAVVLQKNGITLTETTDKGKWKLDNTVLIKLSKKHPICKELLELRKLEKLHSTYVVNLLNSTVNGVLYSNFGQETAKTGRMSSSGGGAGGINLQNIPGKDKTIRKAFISPPDKDYILFTMDYSQIEVRLTAHFSQDPILLDAYNTNQDVHLKTMCNMFGFNYDECKMIHKDENHERFHEIDQLRKVGKVCNFAAVYQVSPSGLSEQIPRPSRYAHLSQDEWIQVCAEFLDKYFDVHRDVKKFIIRSNRFVRQNSYFETTFGRIRHLPHARATKILKDDSKFWMEKSAQRQGTNHGVQGEAADIFKYSVVNVAKFLKKQDVKTRMPNFIHDDAWYYAHKSELSLIPQIKAIMEDWNYRVPLRVDVSYTTTNWADKKSIDVTNMEALMALAD
jgi:DNA polymerase-1